MSREKSTIVENHDFVARFVEACGTSKTAEIAQTFDISYQAAKNYLAGRLPEPSVLINISKSTSFSIHWLLTGKGPKFVASNNSSEMLTDGMKTLIRNECERILADVLGSQVDKEKVIVLSLKDIKEERLLDEGNPVSLEKKHKV